MSYSVLTWENTDTEKPTNSETIHAVIMTQPPFCEFYLILMTSISAKVCENYYESRGCFKDADPKRRYSKRPLEHFLFNEREPTYKNWNGEVISLKMWGKGYLSNLICKCSKAAKDAGYRFFGIQFWGKNTGQKWSFLLRVFQKKWPNPHLVTFTEEIANAKLHFLCSGISVFAIKLN